jgi:hypothetical protein
VSVAGERAGSPSSAGVSSALPSALEAALRGELPARAALDVLLECKDPRAVVASLPSPLLHRLVCSLGLADSSSLLGLAEPEQVRELLDLEVWRGDRLEADEALEWLAMLLSLEDRDRIRHLAGLDTELLGLVVLKRARVFLEDDPDIPEEPEEGVLYRTPDGWFVLEVQGSGEHEVGRVIGLIDQLYADDHEGARTFLHSLLGETESELEERAYRWRCGRLEDLGFADPDQALVVYAYLGPATVGASEGTADRRVRMDPEPVPVAALALRGSAEPTLFFDRALALVESPDERERLGAALLFLGNKSLAADRVHPADTDGVRASLDGLHRRLSLGLEHLSRGELPRAVAVLAQVSLLRIARLGHSLVLDLRRPARAAVREGRCGRKPGSLDLLESPLGDRIDRLLAPRPLFLDSASGEARVLSTLDELSEAARWVEEALAAAALIDRLSSGLSTGAPPAPLTLGDLFRTGVVNRLLGREGPLDLGALARFLAEHTAAGRLGAEVAEAAVELVPPEEPARRLVLAFLARLEEEVASLDPRGLDPRFIAGLWLGEGL